MIIRPLTEDDAPAFLSMSKQIMAETPFMLREPDEISATVEQQREQIRAVVLRNVHLMLVAEQDGQLIGYLNGVRGESRRTHHKLSLAIGILQAYVGKGIGTRLFKVMEVWAKQQGITRLDLTVVLDNHRAIGLYTKQGFTIEGIKRHSLYIDGGYSDEYIMAKLVQEQDI
jgi:RimJ/RimL family protein N-acetyltransferase